MPFDSLTATDCSSLAPRHLLPLLRQWLMSEATPPTEQHARTLLNVCMRLIEQRCLERVYDMMRMVRKFAHNGWINDADDDEEEEKDQPTQLSHMHTHAQAHLHASSWRLPFNSILAQLQSVLMRQFGGRLSLNPLTVDQIPLRPSEAEDHDHAQTHPQHHAFSSHAHQATPSHRHARDNGSDMGTTLRQLNHTHSQNQGQSQPRPTLTPSTPPIPARRRSHVPLPLPAYTVTIVHSNEDGETVERRHRQPSIEPLARKASLLASKG